MIRTTDDGDLRVVTIDRPGRRNALRPTDLEALGDTVEATDAPVVLLRGSGAAFCAGADLDSVASLDSDADLPDPEAFARLGQRVANTIEASDSVVVAGIDGAARGGGVELALACDVRVATSRATLGEPGVRLGLFGAWGGTVRLPRIVGEGHALEFSLSGRVVDADEALRMGLVSRIVDDPREVAASMADNDHQSLRIIKKRLRDRGPDDEQFEDEAAGFAELHRANVDDIAASREE
ncbi:enoyl-CoA hydratase/isomerase family protein [Haloferax mediterranei ATCC 33500]|uniref:Enoyl-CoA hydratase n=1 Tax=Haloferax mediterranei (strain ATCC 33500 / DSM 1411 / JCM 8866 / NBRC 14739 / NCIMB 2177 / R-4) TaxID=523841 RepID=I3R5Z9_HALMT|nr:enoyl-CoA hydratase/isomerase family protein [Haloferax mediterranei]AFK19659.1 enoyl-CoA hydratase [Haloferax mediterranei ATCC 33500]AHZ23048.1 enoyl-CoA hydratase [Haloferax mediterranei ATCC 33500]ELZ99979.1 enoyl-CoA hydratase [Haloferax mediterranei ATCC 33500]MDX5987599.1 enoyl-CoA hydratase/isomerase family protein [Haloferax mediterranei ATCC 33500]QCQ74087.1 enoyl-CoA hydratase/isomerase family protein [Haloferax mediterranei ATCC 33500]